MPYQGDRHPDRPQGRFTTDFSYLRKLPGALILVQLVCAFLGFTLAAAGSAVWRVRRGHAFFTFVSFMSMLSCVCWVAVRVFQLEALFKREINWNVVGLVYNGLNAFFLMVASCLMVEAASSARTLRAAGVFGFLGFSAFLSGLVWEAIVWRSNRDSGPGFSTATVVSGLERIRAHRRSVDTHAGGAPGRGGGQSLLPALLRRLLRAGRVADAFVRASIASVGTHGSRNVQMTKNISLIL
ncbi:CKLF-like MARVEL transmembrane domain-containing protein 4 isoform X2 [Eriocheir sinensis]|uniref:CKLF-like MARVEL transmembrane domain-containing protein 4 isoform X2 n=1 Tax=Eriocheir sinensis TaxID=95602 RepID=UPI0021C99588|nr:CKLF-like MARVEL transmembrane domain-containing protein 4 isoform X2 [Eriocheir sinensis]